MVTYKKLCISNKKQINSCKLIINCKCMSQMFRQVEDLTWIAQILLWDVVMMCVYICCDCVEVAAYGVDPAVRISVFQEFSPAEGFAGVTQVQGFHDDTRAFLFQGKTISTSLCLMQGYSSETKWDNCGHNIDFSINIVRFLRLRSELLAVFMFLTEFIVYCLIELHCVY